MGRFPFYSAFALILLYTAYVQLLWYWRRWWRYRWRYRN